MTMFIGCCFFPFITFSHIYFGLSRQFYIQFTFTRNFSWYFSFFCVCLVWLWYWCLHWLSFSADVFVRQTACFFSSVWHEIQWTTAIKTTPSPTTWQESRPTFFFFLQVTHTSCTHHKYTVTFYNATEYLTLCLDFVLNYAYDFFFATQFTIKQFDAMSNATQMS